jgi:plastocyanin
MSRRPFQSILGGAFAGALLTLAVAAMGSCVSERSTGAATISGDCVAPASAAGATLVFVKQFAFVPAEVHVKPGGSVAWVNCETDGSPHTATADDASFDSGTLAPSNAFIRAFPAGGSFPYHCALHPFMKATVIVD